VSRNEIRHIRTFGQRHLALAAREDRGGFVIAYGSLPPAGGGCPGSWSEPWTIDFAFTGDPGTVIERRPGRAEAWPVSPAHGRWMGGEGFDWVRSTHWNEVVELIPSPDFVASLATHFGRPADDPYPETPLVADPFLFAMAVRIRAHLSGGRPLGDLEGEALAEAALSRVMAGRPRRMTHGLDPRRLRRVTAYIAANGDRTLGTAELAQVAAVSRYHFALMFRRATGLTPHAYVTALRMERARNRIESGASVASAAASVGYAAAHQFRRAFRAHFGREPSGLRIHEMSC
jgi:AraC-like DNA-binding protein